MVYVGGVDIGSAFSKAVVLSSSKLISYHIVPSGGNYRLTADEVVKGALAKANLSSTDITYTVATGYGAGTVSFSNEVITDVSCQSRPVRPGAAQDHTLLVPRPFYCRIRLSA